MASLLPSGRRLLAPALALAAAAVLAPRAAAQGSCLTLTSSPPSPVELSAPLDLVFTGTPGEVIGLAIASQLGPTPTPFGTLDVQLGPSTYLAVPGVIPPSGTLTLPCPTSCGFLLTQAPLFAQAASFSLKPLRASCISNLLPMEFVAGRCGQPCAKSAVPDPTYSSSAYTHCFYMGSLGTDYEFQPAGDFREYADGTATLKGTIVRRSDSGKCFQVDIAFSGRQSFWANGGVFPPAGSPKKSLAPSAYAENGGPVDPLTWHYYESTTGTLTGCGDYSGGVFQVDRRGPAFQVGFGADDKNLEFGASGWLSLKTLHQPWHHSTFPSTLDADINVELKDCGHCGK